MVNHQIRMYCCRCRYRCCIFTIAVVGCIRLPSTWRIHFFDILLTFLKDNDLCAGLEQTPRYIPLFKIVARVVPAFVKLSEQAANN